MRNINEYIIESRYSASDLKKIQYVLFEENLSGERVNGTPYDDLDELIDDQFSGDDDEIEYMGYNSLNEVINDVKKLKPGEKLVLEYHYKEGSLKWYIEMIARLK